jgi:signal transduction histidine kinase
VEQDVDVAHLLTLMQESVARFQRTLGHLTDVSKLQPSHAEPPEAVDLPAQVEAVCLDLAPALAAAGGQLLVDVAACPTLRISPKNLRSMLYNLLSNAIKYHHPDRPPQVTLRAYWAANSVLLEVQDNGLGLTEQEQSKLFVMFRRLHTHVDGTGVGLYMVKRMAENAGGTVRVHSQPGVGSTFTVVLPDRASTQSTSHS